MTTTTTYDLWQHVTTALDWLDAANGRSEHATTMQILKITEEAGEVAAAYIGMTGQNPRKGVTHTREDVAGELCDVVITALVALAAITGSTADAQAALDRHLARRRPRLAALLAEGVTA
ncbi:MazG-like family protein [Nonomuraea sp. SYSU D8015]|uniref:MazG-like family protein n=1 Tax=Nonomuraea sp. SYSU D8015 TaxID=2593644 RepID=UPI0016614A78|nr:MazG-like family protein [Nonomuraea sp. SYSU D8015]